MNGRTAIDTYTVTAETELPDPDVTMDMSSTYYIEPSGMYSKRYNERHTYLHPISMSPKEYGQRLQGRKRK